MIKSAINDQREKSLNKFHQKIMTFELSKDQNKQVARQQQELRDKIQYKFRKSQANKTYKFPRRIYEEDRFDLQCEVVDLHDTIKQSSNLYESKQAKEKPKIKLYKNKNSIRQNTQYQDKENAMLMAKEKNMREKHQNQQILLSSKSSLKEKTFNSIKISNGDMNNRLKTQYSSHKNHEVGYTNESPSIKNSTSKYLVSSFQKRQFRDLGKIKQNELTKSYMNIKKLGTLDKSENMSSNSLKKVDTQCLRNSYGNEVKKQNFFENTLSKNRKIESNYESSILRNRTNKGEQSTVSFISKSNEKIKQILNRKFDR